MCINVHINLDKATEKLCLLLILKFISYQKLVLCVGVSCGAPPAGRLSPLNTPTSSAHSCVSGLQTADRRLSVAQRHLLEDDDNTGRKAADQEVTATAEEGGVFTGETTDH